jgi:hypothetical protein
MFVMELGSLGKMFAHCAHFFCERHYEIKVRFVIEIAHHVLPVLDRIDLVQATVEYRF